MSKKRRQDDRHRSGEKCIATFLDQVRVLAGNLPFLELRPGEDSMISSYLRGDPLLLAVRGLRILQCHPDLFPEAEERMQQIQAHQDRSVLWTEFLGTLTNLQKKARQSYVKEQAAAVKKVLDLLDETDTEQRLWNFATSGRRKGDLGWRKKELLPRFLRLLALFPLRTDLARMRAVHGRRKKSPPGGMAPPDGGSDQGQARSPGKKKTTFPGRNLAKAEIHDLFTAELHRLIRGRRPDAG